MVMILHLILFIGIEWELTDHLDNLLFSDSTGELGDGLNDGKNLRISTMILIVFLALDIVGDMV